RSRRTGRAVRQRSAPPRRMPPTASCPAEPWAQDIGVYSRLPSLRLSTSPAAARISPKTTRMGAWKPGKGRPVVVVVVVGAAAPGCVVVAAAGPSPPPRCWPAPAPFEPPEVVDGRTPPVLVVVLVVVLGVVVQSVTVCVPSWTVVVKVEPGIVMVLVLPGL